MRTFTELFLVLILGFCLLGSAQAQEEELLRHNLTELRSHSFQDSAYASSCLRLGDILLYAKPEEAVTWFQSAAKAYAAFRMPGKEALAYRRAGKACEESQQYGLALEHYLRASKLLDSMGSVNGMANALLDIGMVYYHQSMYSLAAPLFRKAEKLFLSVQDNRGLIQCYNDLGITYRETQNIDSAEILFHKAIAASSRLNDRTRAAESIYHLGTMIEQHNAIDSARACYVQALSLLAVKGYKEDEDIILHIRAIFRLARLANRAGDKTTAESFYLEAVRVASAPEMKIWNVRALSRLGEFYYTSGQVDKALTTFTRTLAIVTQNHFLKEERDTRGYLARIYNNTGDHEAETRELKLTASLSDSLQKMTATRMLSDLSSIINTIDAEHEIVQLKEKNKTNIALLSTVLLVLGSGLLFLFYRLHTLKKNKHYFQNLSNSLFDGIAIVDGETIVDANDKLSTLTGITYADLLGTNIDEFIKKYQTANSRHTAPAPNDYNGLRLTFSAESDRPVIIEVNARPFRSQNRVQTILTFRDITSKLEGEQLVEDATIMLESAIEETPIPMALLSVKTKSYLVINSAAKQFFDYPVTATFDGIKARDIKKDWDEVYPDGRPMPLEEIPLVKAVNGTVTRGQIVGFKKGDRIKWTLYTASPIHNLANEIIAAFVVFTDITEVREVNEKLRNNEARYRMLAENVSDLIWTADLQGNLTFINPAITTITGFTPDELIGKSIFSVLTPDSAAPIRERWLNAVAKLAKGEPLHQFSGELEQYCKDGSTVWTEATVDGYFNEHKQLIGIIGVSRNVQEKRESRIALSLQKSTLESIITNMAQGVYIVSPDAVLLSFNRQFTDLLEIPFESVSRGMTLEALFRPWLAKHHFSEEEMAKFRADRGNPNDISFEIAFMRDNGEKRWVKTFHNPLADGGFVRTIVDITAQKEIEERLYQSEAQYRSILAASPDPILILTLEGNISFISPAGCKLFCFENAELINQPFLEFIVEEDREQIMVHLEILMIQGTAGSMECRAITGDNTLLSLEANAEAIISAQGDVNGIAVALRDITERKRFEQMLIANEDRLNRIMDLMPFPILLTTVRDRSILYVNQSAADTLRIQQDKVAGLSIKSFYADQREQAQFIQDLLTNGYVRDREVLFRRADGDLCWVRISSLKSQIGEDTVIISGLVDITAQKDTAISLIKAKEEADRANRAKSEFLANMSHEIRTPMNAILGFAELLKRRQLDAVAADYLDGIERGGRSLLNLINDILDLSKIEAGKLNIQYYPADIRNICDDLWKIFEYQAKQKGIDFKSNFTAETSSILMIDEVRLRQIILNLLGNAIKFTHEGFVSCSVSIKERSDGSDSCSLTIIVEDTGIGIQDSERERIFHAFHQQEGQSARKYGGTGLGLTITRRLTKLMKGELFFESTPGLGTVFTVRFNDLKHGVIEQADVDTEEINESILFEGQKVLIVEDNESNRKVVHGYLEGHNVTLYDATNGEEGCHLAEKVHPDLILMDLQMPVMDGYHAIRYLREHEETALIPIVIVTASVMQGEKVKVKALADGYLHKPLLKQTLLKELIKHLDYTIPEQSAPVHITERAATPVPAKALSGETIKKLKKEFLPLLHELGDGMVINEIQETASQLQNLPDVSPETELCILSTDLFKSAETFDAAQIESALKELITYISNLS
jgi:two-component system sensor histidine kinase EvgS